MPYSTCKRGVQRGATSLAGGLEGVPPASTIFFPPSFQEGGQGDGPNTCRLTERAARRSLFATGSRGCPPARVSGESRGVQPLWQEVWRVSLQLPLFSSPFLPGRGPGGWSEHLPPNGACSEAKPLCHEFQRVSPSTCKRGVQRGATSLASGMEDVPPASTIFFPLPFRKGTGGWSEHLPPNGACSEVEPLCQGFQRVSPSTCKRGVQRGATSLAGGLEGVPPASTIFFPLPGRKGARGMVRTPAA